MFQIQLTGHEMNALESHQQSEQFQTEEPSTEYKKNDEACRLDMDPRISKRSVKFGGHSDQKPDYMDDDSEQPSDEDASFRDLKPMGGESPGSNGDSEYDPRLEQKIE